MSAAAKPNPSLPLPSSFEPPSLPKKLQSQDDKKKRIIQVCELFASKYPTDLESALCHAIKDGNPSVGTVKYFIDTYKVTGTKAIETFYNRPYILDILFLAGIDIMTHEKLLLNLISENNEWRTLDYLLSCHDLTTMAMDGMLYKKAIENKHRDMFIVLLSYYNSNEFDDVLELFKTDLVPSLWWQGLTDLRRIRPNIMNELFKQTDLIKLAARSDAVFLAVCGIRYLGSEDDTSPVSFGEDSVGHEKIVKLYQEEIFSVRDSQKSLESERLEEQSKKLRMIAPSAIEVDSEF